MNEAVIQIYFVQGLKLIGAWIQINFCGGSSELV